MAWFTLILGGVILLVGLLGQFFGLRKGRSSHPEDRHMGRVVFTVASVVVGLWIVAFITVRVLHLDITGHW
ncbi:MAG: hypothetical protein WBX22_21680 [Silvibacterium sp.]|jgi:hypothetical protein|nr:hypothetical protein [Silvibacterium sp.]